MTNREAIEFFQRRIREHFVQVNREFDEIGIGFKSAKALGEFWQAVTR